LENPEDREEGGLGLFLGRNFSDRLQYEYSNGKNILTIIKKRN
jgi:anti-sigma regulatory factor (Ser/Thr protein kinase)